MLIVQECSQMQFVPSVRVFLFTKQIRCPVDQVEEGEFEWEEDTRYYVNPLGARRKLGQPHLAPVLALRLARRLQVNLT